MITSNKFDQNSLYFIDKKAISKEKFDYLFNKYKEFSSYLQIFVNKVYEALSDELEIVPENDYRTCIAKNIEDNEIQYKKRHIVFLTNVVKFNKKNNYTGIYNSKIIDKISELFREFVSNCNYICFIDNSQNPNFMSGLKYGTDEFHLFVFIDDKNNRYEMGIGYSAINGGFYAKLL